MVRKVLFVCVQNSFRSQVAEAFFNANPPEEWIAVSAGPKPAEKVNPNAVQLMAEKGIDISDKKPKKLTSEMEAEADIVVIVCGGTECPVVNAKYIENWEIEDPAEKSLEDARRIVDKIESKVRDLIKRISDGRVPQEGIRLNLNLE
ncbi:MAG: arsenate reductase ArsC [Thermoproteota archaeon]|nr:arsenate reductase ArsC [Candidatus Brockarchaeota archaeon]